MAKKLYKIVEGINSDQFSNRAAGLEDENVFAAVSDEPTEAIDNFSDEVETQIDDENADETEMFNTDALNDEDDEEVDEEWNAIQSEQEAVDKKDPEDCINLMEIVSCYTNNYRKYFSVIANDKIVEGTGSFSKHAKYDSLNKVFENLCSLYSGTKNEYFENLAEVRDMLLKESLMVTLCGDGKKAPFLYEGLQLAFIAQLHNLYIATPYSLKIKGTFDESIETMGFDKDIKFFDRVLSDFINAKPVLGTKIKYKEPEKSSITGKDETINETVYADSDLISEGHDTVVGDFEFAAESIQNLIEIKANKALLEYNVLIRDCSLVVTYLKTYDPKEHWDNIRKIVEDLLNEEDTTKVESKLVSTCNELDKVLTCMASAYKAILKEKEEE